MKMKHTVRLKSGSEVVYEFQTKAVSKQALENAKTLHKAFNTIVCVFVEPVNYPEKEKGLISNETYQLT